MLTTSEAPGWGAAVCELGLAGPWCGGGVGKGTSEGTQRRATPPAPHARTSAPSSCARRNYRAGACSATAAATPGWGSSTWMSSSCSGAQRSLPTVVKALYFYFYFYFSRARALGSHPIHSRGLCGNARHAVAVLRKVAPPPASLLTGAAPRLRGRLQGPLAHRPEPAQLPGWLRRPRPASQRLLGCVEGGGSARGLPLVYKGQNNTSRPRFAPLRTGQMAGPCRATALGGACTRLLAWQQAVRPV